MMMKMKQRTLALKTCFKTREELIQSIEVWNRYIVDYFNREGLKSYNLYRWIKYNTPYGLQYYFNLRWIQCTVGMFLEHEGYLFFLDDLENPVTHYVKFPYGEWVDVGEIIKLRGFNKFLPSIRYYVSKPIHIYDLETDYVIRLDLKLSVNIKKRKVKVRIHNKYVDGKDVILNGKRCKTG